MAKYNKIMKRNVFIEVLGRRETVPEKMPPGRGLVAWAEGARCKAWLLKLRWVGPCRVGLHWSGRRVLNFSLKLLVCYKRRHRYAGIFKRAENGWSGSEVTTGKDQMLRFTGKWPKLGKWYISKYVVYEKKRRPPGDKTNIPVLVGRGTILGFRFIIKSLCIERGMSLHDSQVHPDS